MKKVKFDFKKFELSEKTLTTLGIIGTVMGIGATLLQGYVGDKKGDRKLDEKVAEKVSEALAKKSE